MRRTSIQKRLLSLVLVLCMLFTMAPATSAAGMSSIFHQVSNDRVTAGLNSKDPVDCPETEIQYAPNDVVRVSIVLDEPSTIEAGYAVNGIAQNEEAMIYRGNLEKNQFSVIKMIEKKISEKLDVVWNLTLAANLISANVKYSQIEAIEKVRGVRGVYIETEYRPDVAEKTEAGPMMSTSGVQTGTAGSYAAGYTGAGSKIAIIDTGLDVDHLSFDASAFEYSLDIQAQKAGVDLDTYVADLDLLDSQDIAIVLNQLQVMKKMNVSADDLYLNSKIPFVFNYVDGNVDVTHLNDEQGEHGSHVAGIAGANAYVPNGDGTFSNALEKVYVQGVAPDAQMIIMKVFGAKGGAYPADYMAAIEDALILGADSVNLSLGSGAPGMSAASTEYFQGVMDSLQKSGVVVTISAGNNGGWMDETSTGYLYLDDVGTHTGGSPGTYVNSLGVASVDNAGFTALHFKVGNSAIVYAESAGYSNAPFANIGGNHEYVMIPGLGKPEDYAAIDSAVLNGKIILCYRGETSFSEKANAAVEAGAAGVVIVNNEVGTINMDLTDYKYDKPVASISIVDGESFKNNGTAVTDDAGNVLYWTGSMVISRGAAPIHQNPDFYTMSDFSSWGVPGSLTMKPEITAPGGNIYSVGGAFIYNKELNFGDHASYESMSGTSMAAPQVAGMAALLAQYIREEGLEEKTGLDARTLAQSLLMSTAKPMVDGTSDYLHYYPVLQQGAGLANVGAAIAADSYILMGADATASYADGKVKVELGDDPNKTGVYTFSFVINNLTGEELTYVLSADFFTQSAFIGDEYGTLYMDTWTVPLAPNVTWTVDDVASADGIATVPADGSIDVTVTVELSEDDHDWLGYYENGAYLEGYVYAETLTNDEGVEGTSHSIPVLGFYGNWSDPSMYDKGSAMEYIHGTETRIPYLYRATSGKFNGFYITDANGESFYFGGNPAVTDPIYMPERNALSGINGDTLSKLGFTLIRNAAASYFMVSDTKTGNLMMAEDLGAVTSAYYDPHSGSWDTPYLALTLNMSGADLPADTTMEFSLIMIPEYYLDAQGNIDWASLGDGVAFSTFVTVDNKAPELLNFVVDEDNDVMNLQVKDNQYIAAVVLYDGLGQEVLTYDGSDPDQNPGDTVNYALNLTGINGEGFYIQVIDYANNVSTYELDIQIGDMVDTVDYVEISDTSLKMHKGSSKQISASVYPLNTIDRSVVWSSSDESIATVDAEGNIHAIAQGEVKITATSVADPTKSATCAIEVIEIKTDMNGIIWDNDGVWFGSFNTSDLIDYERLSDNMASEALLVSACVGPDGTIYASSLDFNTGSGALYAVDPYSYEMTFLYDIAVGTQGIFFSDMTYVSAMYETGCLLGTYGPYVLSMDIATGAIKIIDQLNGDLVGITTVKSEYNPQYGVYEDTVLLIDSTGIVTKETYYGYDGVVVPYYNYFEKYRITFNTGISVGESWYINSAYYDGTYLFWSAADIDNDTSAKLYAIELDTETEEAVNKPENVYHVGTFADGVIPVVGLCKIPLLGDVNMDGVVNTMDANLLLAYYYGNAELTAMQQRAADVNGDGKINAMDANLIVSYFYGNIDKFPAEE